MRPPTNNRRLRRENDRNFMFLAIFCLVVVGGGLIAMIFGPSTLVTALPCLIGGAAMILGPWLLLTCLEYWRKQMDRNS